MLRRTLLAAALAAPALVLLAAPASAGCTDDYVDALTSGREYVAPDTDAGSWATVDIPTLTVTVNGGNIAADASDVANWTIGVTSSEANYAAAATVTFVGCI